MFECATERCFNDHLMTCWLGQRSVQWYVKSHSEVTPQGSQVGLSWVGVWRFNGDICQTFLCCFHVPRSDTSKQGLVDLQSTHYHMYHRLVFHRTQTINCLLLHGSRCTSFQLLVFLLRHRWHRFQRYLSLLDAVLPLTGGFVLFCFVYLSLGCFCFIRVVSFQHSGSSTSFGFFVFQDGQKVGLHRVPQKR